MLLLGLQKQFFWYRVFNNCVTTPKSYSWDKIPLFCALIINNGYKIRTLDERVQGKLQASMLEIIAVAGYVSY